MAVATAATGNRVNQTSTAMDGWSALKQHSTDTDSANHPRVRR